MKIKLLHILLLSALAFILSCTYEYQSRPFCQTDLQDLPGIPGWHFEEVSLPPGDQFVFKIFFLNQDVALAFTRDGIWKTNNFGLLWNKVFHDDLQWIYDFTFPDSINGFVSANVNHEHKFLKTEDGGNSWDYVSYVPNDRIHQLSFVDNLTGYASFYIISESSYYIGKTIDGGLTWSKQNLLSTSKKAPSLIGFSPNGMGYITGYFNEIFITTNSGQAWSKIHSTTGSLTELQFFDKYLGYISDYQKTYKTIDGGVTWQIISKYQHSKCLFISPAEGISFESVWHDRHNDDIVGCMAFLTTMDGGSNWEEGPISAGYYISSIQTINVNLLILFSNENRKLFKVFR